MPPRFIPPRAVMRVLSWIALVPVAWLGAREPFLTGALLVMPLVALGLLRVWSTLLGALSVLAAVFLALRPGLPATDAGVVATLTAGLFAMMTTRARRSVPTLDQDVVALTPHALWLVALALPLIVGANANHVHGVFPKLGAVMCLIGLVLNVGSAVGFITLRRRTARIYRGEHPHLRIARSDASVEAPLLSNVDPLDAIVVEGARMEGGPYRAGDGRVVARVPSDGKLLSRRWAWRIAASVLGVAASVRLGLVSDGKFAHRDDLATTPTKLPPFPAECSGRPPKLRFVALGSLEALDIEEIAERYRRAGIADVKVAPSLPFEDRFLDRNRGQLVAEEIIDAARRVHRARKEREDGALVIVITDRDMFLRDVDWRYAFASRDAGIAVVSVARMDPHFPLLAPATYVPRREECSATLRARAFRMVTRQVLLGVCFAETVEDPRSARRKAVMGVSDLDAIDEATY